MLADYSAVSFHEADLLLSGFGLSVARIDPIKTGFANSSFHISCTSGEEIVLTVLDNHDLQSAERMVVLTDWLVREGVPTPSILRDERGIAIQHHAGRPCVVRPFLTGQQPEQLTESQMRTVGQAMARFHALEVPGEVELSTRRLPEDWRSVLAGGPPQLLTMVESAESVFRSVRSAHACLVHGDLFPDNMIWDEHGSLRILDWETASEDHPELDLGFTLVGLTGGGPLSHSVLDSLLGGYSPAGRFELSQVLAAAQYACAVLAFQRYNRHVLRYPNPDKFDFWKDLTPFSDSLDSLR